MAESGSRTRHVRIAAAVLATVIVAFAVLTYLSYTAAFTSVVPFPLGCSIFTGSAEETKMFRPEPVYLVCSLVASNCNCRVGSRLSGCATFFEILAALRDAGRAED